MIINIDALMGKAKPRVNMVGIELEGGWVVLPAGARLEHDGSVGREVPLIPPDVKAMRDNYGRWPEGYTGPKQVGELPSAPQTVAGFPEWLRTYYPSHVNETCGMHVHMSFKSHFVYQRLMDSRDYQDTIVSYLARWATLNLPPNHHIWPRLAGLNEYCQLNWWPDMQARRTNKDMDHHAPGNRYTGIHFCWGRFQTIECRFLPMMPTVDLAISAIQELINITSAYLAATGRARNDIMTDSFVVTETILKEVHRIDI